MTKEIKSASGQVIAGVLILLSVLAILVPVMVFYAQRENTWTAKQALNTAAFHLAEAGIEKAYNAITTSTSTWSSLIQYGTQPGGFKFDVPYNDIPGGTYAIYITSGPGTQTATIISVGRDAFKKESRAITAVYSNSPLGNISIYSNNGIDVSGSNIEVEWGAIASPSAITTGGRIHPQFWSSSSISPQSTSPTPPLCDQPNCCWWHSYNQNVPPAPSIDFAFYKSSAIAAGNGPCGAYYQPAGNSNFSCTDTSGNPYYFGTDMTMTGNSNHIVGAVIVRGNFSTSNGNLGGANEIDDFVPTNAWKQYCNDWATYQGFSVPGTPAAFPGLNATYTSPTNYNYNVSPVIHGLLYADGNFNGPNGGGNINLVYGVIYIKGQVFLNSNSHVHVYYGADAAANIHTTNIYLSRISWKDSLQTWPPNLP